MSRRRVARRNGDCQTLSDRRKTLIAEGVVQPSARCHMGGTRKGMEHACTEGDLVRVRTADRLRQGAPAEQGGWHEHAALFQGHQRQAPGHHLGRIRADREQPQPRRVRERRLDEVDAEALSARIQGRPWWIGRSAPPPWPPSSRSWTPRSGPLLLRPHGRPGRLPETADRFEGLSHRDGHPRRLRGLRPRIFAGFGFTIPAFKIAGGVLLFGVALEMLHGERPRSRLTAQEREETLERDEVAIVPLGIPLLAGPGAITTVMIYMTAPVSDSADKMFVFAGILVAVLSALVLLHNADRIFRKIGRTGTRAFGRIMGLLLAAIAVQFVIDGIIAAGRLNGLLG